MVTIIEWMLHKLPCKADRTILTFYFKVSMFLTYFDMPILTELSVTDGQTVGQINYIVASLLQIKMRIWINIIVHVLHDRQTD